MHNVDASIAKTGYCYIADTGYKAICPNCAKRHKVDVALRGKERYIEYTFCDKCNAMKNQRSVYGSDEEDS